MKQFLFPAFTALAVAAAGLDAPPLPAPAFADQEVSQDIPLGPAFSAPGESAGTFRVILTFVATPSNNVQFALGRDAAPADGRLDASETAFIAGRDRGAFFLRPRGLAERSELPDEAGPGPETLVFQVRRTAAGGFGNAAFTVNGQPLAFPVPPSPAPEWLDPSGWDILRVTSRGAAGPQASVTVKRFPDGVSVILK
jgi:hypothetical protein